MPDLRSDSAYTEGNGLLRELTGARAKGKAIPFAMFGNAAPRPHSQAYSSTHGHTSRRSTQQASENMLDEHQLRKERRVLESHSVRFQVFTDYSKTQ